MSVTAEMIKEFDRYVLGTYTRNPVVVVKGKGSWVWDAEGSKYLDLFPGWGVSSLGHCHPKVVKAVRTQAGRLLHMPNNYYNPWQGKLAKMISEKSFPGKCFFCNSGAEANEGALKLVRRFGHERGRYEVVSMQSSFHGRTLATVSATGQKKYQNGFDPLVPGFVHAPFNDLEAVERALTERTAAIMLELIQGEGGVNVASPQFVRGIREICDREKILMIVDEVQTGMGRTGHYFAFQAYGLQPDVITLAKALGGGVPIGAFIVKNEFAHLLGPGSHASTFGGNPLACAAALAVFETMNEEAILENVGEMGDYLRRGLEELKADFAPVKEVRGRGLMLGMEFGQECEPIAARCLGKGLIINCTAGCVVRLMPALNINSKEIDQGLAILKASLKEVIG